MTNARFSIELLDDPHDRTTFSCGVDSLDRYLQHIASQDIRRRAAVVYVIEEIEAKMVVGFYTLSATSVVTRELPPDLAKRAPCYDKLPATLLGRLALDTRFHGRGLGRLMLLDALRRSLEASKQVASLAVLVDAKDEAAATFYERFRFVRLPDDRDASCCP